MKNIIISDVTLGMQSPVDNRADFTFREKIETAKLLDRAGVSVIELGSLTDATADRLLIKSVASSVVNSKIAVDAGLEPDSVKAVWNALSEAAHPRLQVCAAVSTSRMEYVYRKKADAMLKALADAVCECASLCSDVEFIAEDATRADTDYLCSAIEEAIKAGAGTVTVCDTAGSMLPDEFGEFIRDLFEKIPSLKDVSLGVRCSNRFSTANASAISAIRAGATEIKVSALSDETSSLSGVAKIISEKTDVLETACAINETEINRIIQKIGQLRGEKGNDKTPFEDGVRNYPDNVTFSVSGGIEEIVKGAEMLGYTLDETDKSRIWQAFCKIAQRKDQVSISELEAIIASEAMQVPPTYTLENYVVTTGNAVDIIAHVKLKKGDEHLDGLSIGDGPIDAAFLAIEKITGHHYELDDFQIQAITEGREAMGQTIVKLRSGGKVYSGKGISTDIIGSGVAAYVSALNKILYEEENK